MEDNLDQFKITNSLIWGVGLIIASMVVISLPLFLDPGATDYRLDAEMVEAFDEYFLEETK